jgi:hypothetical protein
LALVSGVVDALYLIIGNGPYGNACHLYLIIGNGPYGNARYKGQLLVTGNMPITNDGLFVTLDWYGRDTRYQ